jgi:hypothetical protein
MSYGRPHAHGAQGKTTLCSEPLLLSASCLQIKEKPKNVSQSRIVAWSHNKGVKTPTAINGELCRLDPYRFCCPDTAGCDNRWRDLLCRALFISTSAHAPSLPISFCGCAPFPFNGDVNQGSFSEDWTRGSAFGENFLRTEPHCFGFTSAASI